MEGENTGQGGSPFCLVQQASKEIHLDQWIRLPTNKLKKRIQKQSHQRPGDNAPVSEEVALG